MKKIFTLITALLFSFTAMAQNLDTVVIVGGAVGTIVSTQYAIYQSLVKRELKGWSTPETGTSVKLENQCGVDMEFHLIGDYKRNYIMVGISNNSGYQVSLNFRKVKFIVNDSSERYPGYSYQVGDELVNNGWWILASIPLPNKEEFATYDNLKVDVPVFKTGDDKACHIVTEFKRTGHFAKEEQSYNVFEFMFDFGPSLAQFGHVDQLGDPNWIWGMDFNWYFSARHGAGLSFQWEDGYDNTPDRYHYDQSIFSGDFHYVNRTFIRPRLTFNFEPGVGYQGVYSNNYSCRGCDNYDSTFMLDYRLMLQYSFAEWNIADLNVMNYFMGAGMVHQYGLTGDTEGSRLGLLFRIGFGF